MAVDNSVDPAGWLAEQIGACEPDVLRSMAKRWPECVVVGLGRSRVTGGVLFGSVAWLCCG
ncbi:Uncharacterised protein [Actinomadura madurae]|nr:Uncharacterised protein [Actinomadura madurae]